MRKEEEEGEAGCSAGGYMQGRERCSGRSAGGECMYVKKSKVVISSLSKVFLKLKKNL
jgi:hypothetical protein